MSPILPGGRGPRITDDAIPGQEEAYRSRESYVPAKKSFYFSSIASLYAPMQERTFNNTPPGVDIDVFFLYQVDFAGYIENVRYAQAYLISGKAQYALYKLVRGREIEFVQSSTSYFETPSGSAPQSVPNGKFSILTVPLSPSALNVSYSGDSQDLYLGFRVVTNPSQLIGFVGGATLANSLLGWPVLKFPLTAGAEMPKRIPFSAMQVTQDLDICIPLVKYATPTGAQMLGWPT